MTFDLYDSLVVCAAEPSESVRLSAIKGLVGSLPPANKRLLRFLLEFLQKVVAHCETNKMTVNNLAIVFAPNLLSAKGETLEIIARDTGAVNILTRFMIEHASELFQGSGGGASTGAETPSSTSANAASASGQGPGSHGSVRLLASRLPRHRMMSVEYPIPPVSPDAVNPDGSPSGAAPAPASAPAIAPGATGHDVVVRKLERQAEQGGAVAERRFGVELNRFSKDCPFVISYSCSWLEKSGGIRQLGIFRVSAPSAEIAKVKNRFDCDPKPDLAPFSAHAVAGALRLYLRELGEPLFPQERYSKYLEAALALGFQASADRLTRLEQMSHLYADLPLGHKAILTVLLPFLNRVADHSAENKMTSGNLAIIFAPLFFRPKGSSVGSEEVLRDIDPLITLTRLMIDESEFFQQEAADASAVQAPKALSGHLGRRLNRPNLPSMEYKETPLFEGVSAQPASSEHPAPAKPEDDSPEALRSKIKARKALAHSSSIESDPVAKMILQAGLSVHGVNDPHASVQLPPLEPNRREPPAPPSAPKPPSSRPTSVTLGASGDPNDVHGAPPVPNADKPHRSVHHLPPGGEGTGPPPLPDRNSQRLPGGLSVAAHSPLIAGMAEFLAESAASSGAPAVSADGKAPPPPPPAVPSGPKPPSSRPQSLTMGVAGAPPIPAAPKPPSSRPTSITLGVSSDADTVPKPRSPLAPSDVSIEPGAVAAAASKGQPPPPPSGDKPNRPLSSRLGTPGDATAAPPPPPRRSTSVSNEQEAGISSPLSVTSTGLSGMRDFLKASTSEAPAPPSSAKPASARPKSVSLGASDMAPSPPPRRGTITSQDDSTVGISSPVLLSSTGIGGMRDFLSGGSQETPQSSSSAPGPPPPPSVPNAPKPPSSRPVSLTMGVAGAPPIPAAPKPPSSRPTSVTLGGSGDPEDVHGGAPVGPPAPPSVPNADKPRRSVHHVPPGGEGSGPPPLPDRNSQRLPGGLSVAAHSPLIAGMAEFLAESAKTSAPTPPADGKAPPPPPPPAVPNAPKPPSSRPQSLTMGVAGAPPIPANPKPVSTTSHSAPPPPPPVPSGPKPH